MIARHYLLLVLLAASVPGSAVVKRDPSAIVRQAQQAWQKDQYQEASDAIDRILKMPEFAEVDASLQLQALKIGGLAAFAREDYLSAHEFMVLATDFPGSTVETWLVRAQSASSLEDWPDAASSLATVARRWPKAS